MAVGEGEYVIGSISVGGALGGLMAAGRDMDGDD